MALRLYGDGNIENVTSINSAVSAAEIARLDGVTSDIQTQINSQQSEINNKASSSSPNFSGTIESEALLGKQYYMTSGAGTGTAIFDTEIDTNTLTMGHGNQGVAYEVFWKANPNAAGSGTYRAVGHGYIVIAQGWTGSNVGRYIYWNNVFTYQATNISTLTPSVVFLDNGTEKSQSYSGTIRFKLAGFHAPSTGTSAIVYITKKV